MNFFNINYGKEVGRYYMCSLANSAFYMDQPPRANPSIATASRTQRLVTVQELLLEYSLVVIILGCSFLVTIIPEVFRVTIAGEDVGVCWL